MVVSKWDISNIFVKKSCEFVERPQFLMNIDILYTIGKQIKCTFWRSMCHDSSLECVEMVINWSSKKVIFWKSYLEIAKHLFINVIMMNSACSIKNLISFVTSICSTDGLNKIWSKIDHFLPIGRRLSVN